MSRRTIIVTDGQGRTITVDRSDAVQRYRWRCPEGHTNWRPTNSHIYCDECHMAHYHVVDAKEGDSYHWDRVELTEVDEKQVA